MNIHRVPPPWRLPEGVNVPLWEYVHTPRLAVEEDAYFAGHPLFAADARILDDRFVTPGRLVDLGCGAGRHAIRFASQGILGRRHRPVAADAGDRDAQGGRGWESRCCRSRRTFAAWVAFSAGTFDYAVSMFSTLGMIRGRVARRMALAEAFRILRPGGRLALHVHNLWLNLSESSGPNAGSSGQFGRASGFETELGDRRMTYRGIPRMEVHLYRWGELKRELRGAGLRIDEVIPLEDVSYRQIDRPWLLPSIRAGGWIVFARKP